MVYGFGNDIKHGWPVAVCRYGRRCTIKTCQFAHSSLKTKLSVQYSTRCKYGSIETCPLEGCIFSHAHHCRKAKASPPKRPREELSSDVPDASADLEEKLMIHMYLDLRDKHLEFIQNISYRKSRKEEGELDLSSPIDIDRLRDICSILRESHDNLVKALSFVDPN